MKERTEKIIPLGFLRKSGEVVNELEKTAQAMSGEGWSFVTSTTDLDFKTITLVFEREIEA